FLVPGASSGIGAALARMLAEQGATVGIVARRADRLEEVLHDCRKHAPESRMWPADLGDVELAERVALDAWAAFGHLDALVNNAGIPKRREVTALTYDEIEHTMRVNFFSPARMTLALLPKMLERGSGWIVNVSSVAGRLGNLHEAAYSASKFALCGWSEAMAVDLWDSPVKVRLIEVEDPKPIGPDWVVLRPRLTGICGSDTKQVFMDAAPEDIDNCMTALISFPQVLGHEVVADVVEVGPDARGVEVGQRVVLNP